MGASAGNDNINIYWRASSLLYDRNTPMIFMQQCIYYSIKININKRLVNLKKIYNTCHVFFSRLLLSFFTEYKLSNIRRRRSIIKEWRPTPTADNNNINDNKKKTTFSFGS